MCGFQMKGLVMHLALTIHEIWEESQKFYHDNLLSRQNNTIYKNLRPQKIGTMRYYCVMHIHLQSLVFHVPFFSNKDIFEPGTHLVS